jgi:hypothetical protein
VAAVASHPALALAPGNASEVEAVLDCGTRGANTGLATIRVLANRTPTRTSGSPQWSSSVAESLRVRLEPDSLQLAARLQARAADVVLLAVGDEAVIIDRAGAVKLLETSLDFTAMASASGPEIPLLVNLMFERLLGGRLLDEIAIADRGEVSTLVAPSNAAVASAGKIAGARAPSDSSILHDWTRPVLLVALAALLWEILALGLQWLRLREYAGAPSE